MVDKLTTDADQGSTLAVGPIDFTDQAGDAATPTAIVWTLTDQYGNVINSRDSEAYGTPASTIYIVLRGDDLALIGYDEKSADKVERWLRVEATYDTTIDGTPYTGLPLKVAVKFDIERSKTET